MRHFFATQLIRSGENIVWVSRILGYSSIKVTVDTYCRWIPLGNQAAVDRLDSNSHFPTPAAAEGQPDGNKTHEEEVIPVNC